MGRLSEYDDDEKAVIAPAEVAPNILEAARAVGVLQALGAETVDSARRIIDLEAERDRLRALVYRQQDAITTTLHHLVSQPEDEYHTSRDECLRALQARIDDPEGVEAERWTREKLEAAREAGRQEILGTAPDGLWYCPKCDRWQDPRSGCEADIREDERQKIAKEGLSLPACLEDALERVEELEGERDRLRALVYRQQDAITKTLHYLVSQPGDEYSTSRDECLDALQARIDDPEGVEAERRHREEFEAAREQGRQEIRESPENRAGVGLREAAKEQRQRELELYRVAGFTPEEVEFVALNPLGEDFPMPGGGEAASDFTEGPSTRAVVGSLQDPPLKPNKSVPSDPRPYFEANPLTIEEEDYGKQVDKEGGS